MQFRKLAAIGGSALMTGLSLAGAAMAATNVGNLASLAAPAAGAAHFPIFVVGAKAASSDVAGAINVAVRFAAESRTAVAATATTTASSVTGGANLAQGSTLVFIGDPFTVARSTLSSSDLPNILKSDKFTDASGSSYSYDQYIDLGSQSSPIYGRQGDMTEPEAYVNMSSAVSSTSYMYALRAVFSSPINITKGTSGAGETTASNNAAAGQSINLFGSTWTIGTDTTSTKLVLYGSGQLVTAKYQQPVSVSIGGVNHTLEFVGAETATKAQIKIDGTQDAYTEGNIYNRGSPAVTVYTKDVIQLSTTDQTQNSVVVQLGANKVTLTNGGTASSGVNDATIAGTSVTLTVTTGQLSKLVVYTGSGDSNKAYVKKGNEFVDPVFGTVKVRYDGFSPALDATSRDTVGFTQSSADLGVTFPEAVSGKSATIKWAVDPTTGTSGSLIQLNSTATAEYIVVEGQPIYPNDYFLIEAGGEGHLYQYTGSSVTVTGTTTGTPGSYSLLDVFSGETKQASYASLTNATAVSFKVNGQNVYIVNVTTAESGRSANPPIIATWSIGSDPAWRTAPAVAEADGITFGSSILAGSNSGTSYAAVYPTLKLKSGWKVALTMPNATFGADNKGVLTYSLNATLVNNTVQRFLLPTGYLSVLYFNNSGQSAPNGTWFNISATDATLATLQGVSNSTTARAIGFSNTGIPSANTINSLAKVIPILVGRQWYGLQTNNSGGAGLTLNFSLLTTSAATTTYADLAGDVTQPALLFISPKDDNQQYETFRIAATDTSTGAALTTAPTFSETSGVTRFSAASTATPTTTKYLNLFGALITQDTNAQGSLSISLPTSEPQAQVYMLEKTATTAAATAASGTSYNVLTVTADIAKLDTEVTATDKSNSDFVVVGGPCVNQLAATLLGKTYPACADETATTDADALTKTGIPKNAAIVKVFADKFAAGKTAVLIAGWRAADTNLASLAVQQDKLAGKTDMAVKVSGSDVATATVDAFSG